MDAVRRREKENVVKIRQEARIRAKAHLVDILDQGRSKKAPIAFPRLDSMRGIIDTEKQCAVSVRQIAQIGIADAGVDVGDDLRPRRSSIGFP